MATSILKNGYNEMGVVLALFMCSTLHQSESEWYEVQSDLLVWKFKLSDSKIKYVTYKNE